MTNPYTHTLYLYLYIHTYTNTQTGDYPFLPINDSKDTTLPLFREPCRVPPTLSTSKPICQNVDGSLKKEKPPS